MIQIKWNQNGNWLLTASRDHLLKLFDIRMMKELQTFRGHKREATGKHTLSLLASSRRSVSQGAVQKTAREKIKKSAARGSERTPVGKLNKRTFRPLIDRLQRPVNMTAGLWFSVVNLSLKNAHGIF